MEEWEQQYFTVLHVHFIYTTQYMILTPKIIKHIMKFNKHHGLSSFIL